MRNQCGIVACLAGQRDGSEVDGESFALCLASWQREFLQNGHNINAAFFEAGPRVPFSYATEAPQRDYLYAGAGLSAQLGDRWEAYLSYSAAAAATDLISNNIFLGLQFNF